MSEIDTTAEAVAKFDEVLASQIGDDIGVIFDREYLHRRSRALLRALAAERDRLQRDLATARAETAAMIGAAYAAAAKAADDAERDIRHTCGGFVSGPAYIETLTPADATAALKARDRATREAALREAVKKCAAAEQETRLGNAGEALIFHLGFTEGRKVCERAILALLRPEDHIADAGKMVASTCTASDGPAARCPHREGLGTQSDWERG